MRVLIIDVGGSNVKLWLEGNARKREFDSGEELTPEAMVEQSLKKLAGWKYDRIALGLPCRVIAGRPITEPFQLAKGWIGFNFESAFGVPVRIMNDADLQALGCYRGGRMLFIGLGTHVGSTLIADRVIVSLDLGHLHDDEGQIYDQLGKSSLKEIGKKEWNKRVLDIIPHLQTATMADDVVLGGGNAEELEDLPKNVRLGGNETVVEGGIRLWKELPDPTERESTWRMV